MQLIIKIQSISDIVTNSSSELFSVKSDLSAGQLQVILRDVNREMPDRGCSGSGGTLEVTSFDDSYYEALEWVPKNKRHLYTKEIHAIGCEESVEELESRLTINIDEAFTDTIDWIIKNLYVVEAGGRPAVRNKEGRILQLLSWSDEDRIEYTESNKLDNQQ